MPKVETDNLALRRSLFFPTAEIYAGAPSGFYDYGPYGCSIRRKILDLWRKELIQKEGFVEIYGRQILPESVFRASGHLESFADPIIQCKKCGSWYRADSLISEKTGKIVPESLPLKEMDVIVKESKLDCPKCKAKDFTETRKFNMMMKVEVGAMGQNVCYLRPETCQTIFLDFSRLYKTNRLVLPVGICQAGTSFRNEISPRQGMLREREIGQMEIEIFFDPDKINDVEKFSQIENEKLNLFLLKSKKVEEVSAKDAVSKKIVFGKLIAYYLFRVQQFYQKLGIPLERMRFRELEDNARAFYAKETWDFEVETDLGWIELMACNYRADFDLKGHSKESRQDLSVVDDSGKKILPHVFELSAGIDRAFYVCVDLAFRKEKRGPDERIFLKLPLQVSPYFAGIFPLVKKDGLFEKAYSIFEELNSDNFEVFFDEKGSIGKRYARIDEIGVPFAITVDYDSMKDGTVTLRERDSLEQKRVEIRDLPELFWKLQAGKTTFEKL